MEKEFHFKCKNCKNEWSLNKEDKDLKVSPPACLPFYAYSYCPNCNNFTIDTDSRARNNWLT